MYRVRRKGRQESIFRASVLESVWKGYELSCPFSEMPAIDLSRLRKQAARLDEFFFAPDEFIKHLHEMLEFYVNRTVRKVQANAPSLNLQSYHTPSVIIKQIEQELKRNAGDYPEAALELADRLWDEGYLETRLLAAFLLGCIPPQEEHLLARLTAWTLQMGDPGLREGLLNTSLARMRREAPDKFLELLTEWLHPERTRLWSVGIQAVISAVIDPSFVNLPPLLKIIEPVIMAAPSALQTEIQKLILALYKASPTETTYFLHQVLSNSDDPMTAITFRRISPSFPAALREELRIFLRAKPLTKGD